MMTDLRIAFRKLRKSPGFAVTAILTLALGIGANAVVFSVLNAVVLRPVKVPNAQNLYMVQRFKFPSQSYPDYLDLRDRNRTFESMVMSNIIGPVGVDTGGNPSTAWPYLASGNYFDALGIQPYLGRFYHASDEKGTEQRSVCGAELRVLAWPFSWRCGRSGADGAGSTSTSSRSLAWRRRSFAARSCSLRRRCGFRWSSSPRSRATTNCSSAAITPGSWWDG